jgi:hypothetical protein
MGFLLDHKSLKIGSLDVERSFTSCRLVELCQEVVNLKSKVDREEEPIYLFYVWVSEYVW